MNIISININRFFFIALVYILLLSGCGKPKIDLSNDLTKDKSIKKIVQCLDSEGKNIFYQSFNDIYMAITLHGVSNNMSGEEIDLVMKEHLHGLTSKEIIASSKDIKSKISQYVVQNSTEE